MMRPNMYYPNNYNEYQMLHEMRYFEVGRRFVRTAKRDLYRKLKAQQNKKKRKKVDSENFPSLPFDKDVMILKKKVENQEEQTEIGNKNPDKPEEQLETKIENQREEIKEGEDKVEDKVEDNRQWKENGSTGEKKEDVIDSQEDKPEIECQEKDTQIEPNAQTEDLKNLKPENTEQSDNPETQEESSQQHTTTKQENPAQTPNQDTSPQITTEEPTPKPQKPKRKKKKQKPTQIKTFKEIIKVFKKIEILAPNELLNKHKELPVIDTQQEPQIEHITATRAKDYRRDYKRDHYGKRRDTYRSRKGYDHKKRRRAPANKPQEKISLAKGKYPNMSK